MAKDQRLYMTFPNDFWMHPKVAPLSTEAKWTFVEMNGYSRMQDLDGRIPGVMVDRLWDVSVVSELIQSHPERPLVLHEGDTYVIRDYAKHQQTTADRDELSNSRSEAGKRGANRRWGNGSDGKPIASAMANAWQDDGKHIAETETETLTTPKGVVPHKRGTRIDENFTVTAEMVSWAKEKAPDVDGKRATEKFINHFMAKSGRDATKIDWNRTWKNWLLNDQERAERTPSTKKPKDEQILDVIEQGRRMQAAEDQKGISA